MIPGTPHPLLMAGGDPIDEMGVIAQMVRCRPAGPGYLSRSVTSASTSYQKGTIFFVLKRCALSTSNPNYVFSSMQNTPPYRENSITFESDDSLRIYFGYQATVGSGWTIYIDVKTVRKFRDIASLLFGVLSWDTTQAVAANRISLEINGEKITSFSSAIYPSLNDAIQIDQASFSDYIGWSSGGGVIHTVSPSDSAFGFFGRVDGQVIPASALGAFHSKTKQWRPKTKAGIRAAVAVGGGARNGWGTNGFFLPFETSDFSGTTVYDRSQSETDTSGNNWTLNNINVTTVGSTFDLLTDGTANFATMSSLAYRSAVGQVTVSNGGLRLTNPNNASGATYATFGLSSGTAYWEATISGAGGGSAFVGVDSGQMQASTYTDSIYWNQNGTVVSAGSVIATIAAYAITDVLGIKLDKTANTVSLYKQTGGTGAFVLQGTYSLPTNVYTLPIFSAPINGGVMDVSFGQQVFGNTSAPAKGLSAKNLPLPKIPNPASCFAAVTDSGANILATLAAARPGWTDYIDIVKRRDPTAEGWRWSFSDDPGYAFDSSSSAAGRFAYPALGGTSYSAFSIKVSAANGVATGRLNHVNGTADTVTDGLGNVRKAIILFSETSGNWFFYHPDLTSGKLLYLNSTAAETTDASISGVLSNSFVAAAALPTGMYRWVALAEVDGLLKLFKHSGNASGDGPFDNLGFSPAMFLEKNTQSATGNWCLHDIARDKANVMSALLQPHLPNGEATSANFDAVSNGIKTRWGTNAEPNISGGIYAGIAIAAFPFRYANAR
jgi:hypothetical protein